MKQIIFLTIMILILVLALACGGYQITYEEVTDTAVYCEENDMWVAVVYDPLTWVPVDTYCLPRIE